MAITLDNQSYTITIKADHQNTLDVGVAKLPVSVAFMDTLTTGTAVDQSDLCFTDDRTLTAGASENLDLAGGLVDAFGQTITLARVKLLYIQNTATTAGANLLVGAAASNTWTGWTSVSGSTVYVGPGGALFFYNPSATAFPVTPSTGTNNDTLKVNNPSGVSITYRIVVIGASA